MKSASRNQNELFDIQISISLICNQFLRYETRSVSQNWDQLLRTEINISKLKSPSQKTYHLLKSKTQITNQLLSSHHALRSTESRGHNKGQWSGITKRQGQIRPRIRHPNTDRHYPRNELHKEHSHSFLHTHTHTHTHTHARTHYHIYSAFKITVVPIWATFWNYMFFPASIRNFYVVFLSEKLISRYCLQIWEADFRFEKLISDLRNWFQIWEPDFRFEKLISDLRSWFQIWEADFRFKNLILDLRTWFPIWEADFREFS